MEKTISELKESNMELSNKLSHYSKDSKEIEQEKVMLKEIVENESAKTHALSRKYYLTIAIAGVAMAAVIIPYSLFVVTLVGQEYQLEDLGSIKSGYLIQNLKGDTIDTWLSWRLTEGDVLRVNIVNRQKLLALVERLIERGGVGKGDIGPAREHVFDRRPAAGARHIAEFDAPGLEEPLVGLGQQIGDLADRFAPAGDGHLVEHLRLAGRDAACGQKGGEPNGDKISDG